MKILCISKYASPSKYGVGARLYYLAKKISDSGNNVTLVSSDSNHLATYPISRKTFNYETIGNLNHTWIRTYKYGKSSSIKRFLSWIDFDFKLFRMKIQKENIPDVVIISSLSLTTIVYGIHLKRKYKCKLIFEVRDIYPLTLTEEMGFSKYHPAVLLFSILERKAYKKSDLIVGTMPNLSEHVRNILKKDKYVFHSPIGIPEIWNRPVEESIQISQLFPKNKIIVGYAGSMGKSNALESLVLAIKQMEILNPNIYFVLVGEGEKKHDLLSLFRNLNNVTLGPKIKQSEVPYFLSKCDILYLSTHPSRIWEFGQSMNKVIDYMMSGKPVVASYNGYQSMLNEANSGVFIPVNSTEMIIESILKYAEMSHYMRKEIGQQGKEWVTKFYNYDKLSEDYLNEIKRICGK